MLLPVVGGHTLVDELDAELVAAHKWYVWGCYVVATVDCRTVGLHRVIAGTPKGLVTDHINGNTYDNRRANLRHATYGENRKNTAASRAAAAR